MFKCPSCANSFGSSKAMLSHVSFFHSDYIARKEFVCVQLNCFRSYTNFKSYSKHIQSHENYVPANTLKHKLENSDLSNSHSQFNKCSKLKDTKTSYSNHVEDEKNNAVNDEPFEFDSVTPPLSPSLSFDDALTNAVVSYVASLYDSSSLSESEIQLIIDAHKKLLGGGFLAVLKEKVCNVLRASNCDNNSKCDDEIKEISRMFDCCEDMFSGFETHYKRMQEFEKSGCYIKPVSYTIGHAPDEKTLGGQVVVTPTELTGQFIPMRSVLKGFLELPNVFQTICNYKKELDERNDGIISNIVQGSLWKDKIQPRFGDKCVLPLILYFDEYEANKELGTHTGVHKIGATYYRIACLPPKYSSSLDNIFVANLFHSADRAFGNAKAFRKVIQELKYLENTGITIVTDNCSYQAYFALCLVSGDNLGANAVLGFVESFSANFYCRVCKEHKKILQKQTMSNPAKRRTRDNYAKDVLSSNESETGIKAECIFNELYSFHNTENVHLDIMHDLDEGVWNYSLCAIISYFVKAKRFCLEELNNLIQGFQYGISEQRNKPPFIQKEHLLRKKLACSASELRCLMRYFGLMVGHLVKADDNAVWNLYITGRKIMDIVTAPGIPISHVRILRGLIDVFLSSYLALFSEHLYPKMHFMSHEPDIIPEIGPLEPVSCIRMEAKHKEGKRIAHTSSNRINLPFTIAKRQQLKFCFRLLSGRGLSSSLSSSPVQVISFKNLQNFEQVSQSLVTVKSTDQLNTVKWVSLNGTKYVLGSIVIMQFIEGIPPKFGKVHSICLFKNNVKFLLQCLKTVRFDPHYHAYSVEYEKEWLLISHSDLHVHTPCEIRTAVNGQMYVALRCALF